MPRNRCYLCGEEIEKMDFYIESGRGNICSDCLVQQKAPREDIRALFWNRREEEKLRERELVRMAAQNYW